MISSLLAIPNLSAQQTFEVEPWTSELVVPGFAASDPEKYSIWKKKPTTKYCFFTGFVGEEDFLRVTKANPPAEIRAYVIDYDTPWSPEKEKLMWEEWTSPYLPTHISKTYSNRIRMVFMLDRPVRLGSLPLVKEHLKIAAKEMKLDQILPGFDSAFFDPSQYYALGHEWQVLDNNPLRAELAYKWLFEAGNRIQWNQNDADFNIPLDRVAEEVENQFPGAWPGKFEAGARGPTFWDQQGGHKSLDSAIVRESGMQAFNMPKAFYSWREILGSRFVDEFEIDRGARIKENIFYDGQNFWLEGVNSRWEHHNKEMMKMNLAVDYGLERKIPRGAKCSEIERVIREITKHNRIEQVLPFVQHPPGRITLNGASILNTCTTKALTPAESVNGWGDQFPWIAEFLDQYFSADHPEQKEHFLAWWRRFYRSGLELKPTSGQAMYHCGPAGTGKNVMNTLLVGPSVGGFADAKAYLVDNNRFTGNILTKACWVINDSTATSSYESHSRFSAQVKALVANDYHVFDEKYIKAGQVTWLGRLIISTNLDAESMRMLPELEGTILDKLMLLQVAGHQLPFPEKLEETTRKELPFFLCWLYNSETPSELYDRRFGVKTLHHPALLKAGVEQGVTHSFLETLVMFLDNYRRQDNNHDKKSWEGTASELFASMGMDGAITAPLIRKLSNTQVGRRLGQLQSQGYPIERSDSRTRLGHVWKIPVDLEERGNQNT